MSLKNRFNASVSEDILFIEEQHYKIVLRGKNNANKLSIAKGIIGYWNNIIVCWNKPSTNHMW
jgi:hypothetical protein